MKTNGNGDPITCAGNLLKLLRGDIPLDGLRGLPREVIDRPETIVAPQVREAVRFLAEKYEPRLDAATIEMEVER